MATITGRIVNGSTRMDFLFGSARDDIFNPKGGNDTVFAGYGVDTVMLTGSFADYVWSADRPNIFNLFGLLGPSFTVKGLDGTDRLFGVELLRFDDATVDLRTGVVTRDNRAPVGLADSITVGEGATASTLDGGATSVLANDTDINNDPLSAILVAGPSNGILTFNSDGTFNYVHDGSETTTDSFTYKANDGTLDGNPVTVSIAITPVNDAPVAVDDAYTVPAGQTLTVSAAEGMLSNDTDAEGDSLNVIQATLPPSHALSLTVNGDGSFSYAPLEGFVGVDTFGYIVIDGKGGFDTGTVTIDVRPTMIGASLRLTYELPDKGTIIRQADVIVGDGAETTLASLIIDVEADKIVISAAEGTPDFEFTSASFNGVHIQDAADNLDQIAGVTLSATTNVAGLDEYDISFDGDNIWINLAGVIVDWETAVISFDVQFA